MLFDKPDHSRDYPYRPPLIRRNESGTDWPLYLRFIRAYVWPSRWPLSVCILLVAINSNYAYVISFFSRKVVDDILVIEPDILPKTDKAVSITQPDRERQRPSSRPEISMGKKMERVTGVSRRPPEAGRRLLILAVIYLITQFFFNTISRIATRRQIVVAQNIMAQLREDMHRKVLELSLSYHHAMSPGRLLSRILTDVDSAQAEMMALFVSGAHCFSMILTGTMILLFLEWRMALLAALVMPLYGWMFQRKRPEIRRLNQEQRHTNACLYGLVSQKIDAMKAVQSYAREPGEALAFHRLIGSFFRDAMKVQWIALVLQVKAGLLAHLCNCAIFLYGGKMVLDGEMTLGKLIFVQSATLNLFQPVLEATQLVFVLQRLRVSLSRLAGVLDKQPEIADEPDAVDFPRPIRQGIEVRHLEFSYPTGKMNREADDDDDEIPIPPTPVLSDISFTVKPGTWLCIMGASGAGKSTLLNLLSRLYEPTKGEILIDGVSLSRIRMRSLRCAAGVVPQEAQIFGGTMRENIAYGFPEAGNEEIMAAARAAQMHEFIMDMQVQYETLIGQKGTSLSGGQRQRLSLARALLTNPELLILDDCTSALDANTERKIQETLSTVLQHKTAIMVSQRVSMAMLCHKILVLENGRIKEYGTHKELLTQHGFYAKLHSQQTE